MAYEVTLPRLGWDMEEGALAGWLKQDGEYVRAGELLFAVEGDKAVQEVEALDSGYLRILPDAPAPGVKVPVGTLLAYLVPEEELASFSVPGATPPGDGGQKTGGHPNSGPQPGSVLPPSPSLRSGSEPTPASSAVSDRPRRIYISPYARRVAEGLGVDWRKVKGSGLGGRIMARDVRQAAARKSAPAPVPPARPAPAAPAGVRVPMTPLRKTIAEHMARSAHTTAPVTLTAEVDATELVALRNTLKGDPLASRQPIPSYNDILAKIAAQALLEHPYMNARIEGEEIVQVGEVHVGIAVDTERGLIVPVVRDVQAKTLRQIARESAGLIEKTRNGTISYDDLRGATFTITNLGMFEIDAFTPIIDLPQCAILGVGQIVAKQVVVDAANERMAIRQRMVLSLTFDHRLVDGAQAARFLQRIKRLIENPYLWLVE